MWHINRECSGWVDGRTMEDDGKGGGGRNRWDWTLRWKLFSGGIEEQETDVAFHIKTVESWGGGGTLMGGRDWLG